MIEQKQKFQNESVPVWFNENNERKEVTEEERRELEALLEEFR